ncbi:T9SS type A sorting domain-containing protein [Candidatus Pollutiaquabacter sp.]|uniref:T9SS type A sorting domain-containing protein n=1 Tax=Candidatus Pollutiaquabacter sp. TaxID=3416354 RepID=UPI003C7F10A8|nr:T9SS type A sorting domain-containing protein [Bacteroidota bacterium]
MLKLLRVLFIAVLATTLTTQAQTIQWSRTGLSEGYEYGNGIITDDSGYVYVVGQSEYGTDFGGGVSFYSAGQHDIFLCKYSPTGTLLWMRHAGGSDGDAGSAIGLDAQRNVYIVGEFETTCYFSPTDSITVGGANDSFIAKYDNNGNLQWVRRAGGSSDCRARGLAVDADGNSYWTGGFGGTSNFGGINITSSNGGQDCYIAKYNANGQAVWVRKGGGNRDDRGRGAMLDGQGNLYVVGSFGTSATFSGTTITSNSAQQGAFLAKYDTSGSLQWILPMGGCCDTIRAYSITRDNAGNIYTTGYFGSTMTLGSLSITSAGSWDIFFAKVDPNGNPIWLKRAGYIYEDFGQGLAYSPSRDEIYLSGQFDDRGVFDTLTVYGYGNRDFFVSCYDTSGRIKWVKKAGSPWRDAAFGVAVADNYGAVYATGFFNDTALFGGTTLYGNPLADFVVTQITLAQASQPTTATSNLALATGNCNDLTLRWTNGNGTRRLVVARQNGSVNALPIDGSYYTANSVFGLGSNLGSGNYVVYDGTDTTVTVTGLTVGERYFFAVIEYNGTGFTTNYLTTGYPQANQVANSFNFTVSTNTSQLCNGGSATLTASTASSYSWSPATGLSSTTSQIVTATPTVTTTYTVTGNDGSGCIAVAHVTITVGTQPTVILNTLNAVCTNSAAFALTTGTPTGGTYSGPGVSAGNFNPSAAGAGVHIITYTVNSGGCSGTDTATIRVNAAPVVSFAALAPACSNGSAVTLSGGSPAGGTYSGTGVSGSSFNPVTAGTGTFVLTYAYTDNNGCSGNDTSAITVNAAPTVSLGSFTAVCQNAGVQTLSGGSPAGGTYSGPGVSGTSFDPAVAGAGNHTITYAYTDAAGCSNSATATWRVNALPNVTLATLPNVCSNTPVLNLTGGSPAGGTYSGTGVSGSTFNPAVSGNGTFAITYTYTDNNGCTNSAQRNIVVNAAPSVTFSTINPVCLNASPVTLTGGSPAGGTYVGTGVSGGQFNPSVGIGTYSIQYLYTDMNGCTGSASQNVQVRPLPTVALATLPAQCSNSAPLTLTGGSPAGGTYSGTGVSGGAFDPSVSGTGTFNITYTYTDNNGCTNSAQRSITVNAAPVVSLGNDSTVCSSAVVQVNAGSGFVTYRWSNGATTQSINVDSSGTGIGVATVWVTVTNAANCSAQDTLLITFDACAGITPGPAVVPGVYVFPNPTTEEFIILTGQPVTVTIYDANGKLLFRKEQVEGRIEAGRDFAPGMYLVEVTNQTATKVVRAIKSAR